MFRKMILPAALGLSALSAIAPTIASAQSYGGQIYAGNGYRDDRYDERRGYDDRGGYDARQRWVAHRRWEQQQRAREWRREHWRDGDRHDGWSGDRGQWDRRDDYR